MVMMRAGESPSPQTCTARDNPTRVGPTTATAPRACTSFIEIAAEGMSGMILIHADLALPVDHRASTACGGGGSRSRPDRQARVRKTRDKSDLRQNAGLDSPGEVGADALAHATQRNAGLIPGGALQER